jgi:predicted branched-subunit amino acid permease
MTGMQPVGSGPRVRSVLATSLPVAAAIAVFGTLYGAGARPLLGVPLTIASSLFIFSGSLQFALVALLSAGAAAPALLLTAGTLNLRHLVLGAVLRPRIGGSRLRRAALAFFLVDETFGFAVAAGDSAEREGRAAAAAAERTLLVSGVVCYLAWQVGTLIGVLGAGLPGVEGVAGAIFPVLFIGLASLACRTRTDAVRALAAAALTAGVTFALPDLRALAPVVAGVLVALPGRKP